MRIRTAVPEDLDQICEIEELCFPAAEAATRSSLQERLKYYPDHFWVAEENGEIIGFINGLCTDHEHLEDIMYDDASMHTEAGEWQMIFGVDTRPSDQHRGIASRLMRHVIGESARQRRKGIVLTCKEPLVPFYASFGFEDEGISDSEHGNTVWHEMRKITK